MDFVVVVTFESQPEHQLAHFQLLDEYIDGFLRHQPGFIESRLNQKPDGSGFLHFARWEKESDFRAFAEKAQAHPLLAELRKLNGKPDFYEVAKHYQPND